MHACRPPFCLPHYLYFDHQPDVFLFCFFFSFNALYEVTRHGLSIKMTELTDSVMKKELTFN